MQHRRRAGGAQMSMEIDHFDPTITGRKRHVYSNLFLASRFCNNRKQANWPSPKERRLGFRFLNCCEEIDYGEQILEDPTTHRLVGTSKAAIYHIRVLDLNAQHLIDERRDRAELRKLLFEDRKRVKETQAAMTAFRLLRDQLDYLIPSIKYARSS
jgi:hypothetical protein